MKNDQKMFLFTTSQTKLWLMQNHFDKVDGFIRVADGTRYLVLFDPEKYNVIFKRKCY